MEDSTRENLVRGSIWIRGLHALLFVIAYNIAEIILVLLAIFQFLSALITGRVNEPLLKFGKNLSIYVEDIFEFITFNTEVRPFPFEPWPDEPAGGEEWRKSETDAAEPSSTGDSAVAETGSEDPDKPAG